MAHAVAQMLYHTPVAEIDRDLRHAGCFYG